MMSTGWLVGAQHGGGVAGDQNETNMPPFLTVRYLIWSGVP
jgi:hypothetical protein